MTEEKEETKELDRLTGIPSRFDLKHTGDSATVPSCQLQDLSEEVKFLSNF